MFQKRFHKNKKVLKCGLFLNSLQMTLLGLASRGWQQPRPRIMTAHATTSQKRRKVGTQSTIDLKQLSVDRLGTAVINSHTITMFKTQHDMTKDQEKSSSSMIALFLLSASTSACILWNWWCVWRATLTCDYEAQVSKLLHENARWSNPSVLV